MNKNIEQLMKEREPIHEKCMGVGFTDEQREFMHKEQCSRIESQDVVVDEETGEVEQDCTSLACFCSSYVRPSIFWNHPSKWCPLADHYRPDLQAKSTKVRAGQQKQKKKGRR
jgi:hypothetical protein